MCGPDKAKRLSLRNKGNGHDLVSTSGSSVTFMSPGYEDENYLNRRFCIYNISVGNFDNSAVVVKSTSDQHSLFENRDSKRIHYSRLSFDSKNIALLK